MSWIGNCSSSLGTSLGRVGDPSLASLAGEGPRLWALQLLRLLWAVETLEIPLASLASLASPISSAPAEGTAGESETEMTSEAVVSS